MSFFSEVQLEDKFGPFVAFQEALGFIPNLLHAQTLLPRVIEAQAKLEGAVRLQEGAISRVQKERILLSIAVDRQEASVRLWLPWVQPRRRNEAVRYRSVRCGIAAASKLSS